MTPFGRIPLPVVLLILAVSGCAGRNHLGDYDYRGRSVAVAAEYPPYPEVLTGPYLMSHSDNPVHDIVKAGSQVAKEIEARRVRARLDSAARKFNVANRVSDLVGTRAARSLAARLVLEEEDPDFVLEIRVGDYGIDAKEWEAAAHFFVEAEVVLLDRDGRSIWKTRVRDRDPISPAVLGGRWHSTVRNVVTAALLADLTVEELVQALQQLADYSADHITRRLRDGLERARR